MANPQEFAMANPQNLRKKMCLPQVNSRDFGAANKPMARVNPNQHAPPTQNNHLNSITQPRNEPLPQLLYSPYSIGCPLLLQPGPSGTKFVRTNSLGKHGLLKVEPKPIVPGNIEAQAQNTASTHPVETATLPKKYKRLIELPKYESKREELQKNNKPYYNYVPRILDLWQESDYLKHKELYQNPGSTKVDEENLEEITLDVSQFKKGRTIVCKPLNVAPLKRFIKPKQRSDRWWIVTDTKVMLDDMKFMDKLIKSDPECRMRMPYEVLHDLSAMTAKWRKAWMRIPARRVVQYLETACDIDKIIKVQALVENEDVLDSPVATDAVLNCCLHLEKLYYYVVLISDDEDRRKRAASVQLPSFSLAQVKSLVGTTFTNPIFDSPKENVNVTITNDARSAAIFPPMEWTWPVVGY